MHNHSNKYDLLLRWRGTFTILALCFSILLIQSCSCLRTNEKPKYSKFKNLSRKTTINGSYTRFSKNVTMAENEGFVIFVYDHDSLFLDKSMSKYSCLFQSGLISNQSLQSFDSSNLVIYNIEEVKYLFHRNKVRVYRLRGGQKHFLNGLNFYIEIKNSKANVFWNLERFVNGAIISKSVTFVLI